MEIHERIKARRLALGLSADDIAGAIGVSRATVYRYESKDIEKLPLDILAPLAEALKTTPSYLMGWDDNPTAPPQNILPLKPAEIDHIQKYRRLTDNGRATVDNVIDGLLEAGQPAREPEQKEPEKIVIPIAARNGTGKQLELTPDELRRLQQVIKDSQDQDLSGIV